MKKICVIGSGSFGCAIASKLAKVKSNNVTVISRSTSIADAINKKRKNEKYLPGIKLSKNLRASTELPETEGADYIFLAIPSKAINEFVLANLATLNNCGMVVNLAKGFDATGNELISSFLSNVLHDSARIASAMGPTFSIDLLLSPKSGFTVASRSPSNEKKLSLLLQNAGFLTDTTISIEVIEYLSILKNVYAMIFGIIEAKNQNPNLRGAIFTRSIVEIREITSVLTNIANVDTLKYCGVGDFLLTSLNDQSRNRTLGLMVGKRFLKIDSGIDGVVIEGFRSVQHIVQKIGQKDIKKFPLIYAFNNFINKECSLEEFTSQCYE